MDFDILIKGAPIVLGFVATTKLVYDWVSGRYAHLRSEYAFARDFLEDIAKNPKMHHFVKQKGYQAIAGDARISASEVEYLLSLNNAGRALSDYVLGREYLSHASTAGKVQVAFKPRYSGKWSRQWRKSWYFFLYFFLFVIAFCPLVIGMFYPLPGGQIFAWFAYSFVLAAPLAVYALRAGVQVSRAELLVEAQHPIAS
jgi:hypothetical protein